MNFFRSLFDRLSAWAYPDPEKMPEPGSNIPPPSSFVRFVFEEDTYINSVQEALKQFKLIDKGSDGADRLEELSECRVIEIEHYRRAGGLKVHEFTLLKIARGIDLTFAKMERFRGDLKDRRSNKQFQVASFHDFLEKSQLLIGNSAASKDKYSIIAEKEGLTAGCKLVQSLTPPPALNLDILDCIVLANTISEEAKDYTVLHHMCMWWAAVFFITIHRFSEAVMEHEIKTVHGQAYKQRGMFRSIRLVNGDGELCLHSPNIVDNFLRAITKSLGGRDADQNDVKIVAKEIKKDVELEKTSHLSPLDTFSQFKEDRIRIRNEIRHDIEVRNEERRRQAQKDVVIREKDVALGEKDVALGEKDVALGEKDVALREKDIQLEEAAARIIALEKQLAGTFPAS